MRPGTLVVCVVAFVVAGSVFAWALWQRPTPEAKTMVVHSVRPSVELLAPQSSPGGHYAARAGAGLRRLVGLAAHPAGIETVTLVVERGEELEEIPLSLQPARIHCCSAARGWPAVEFTGLVDLDPTQPICIYVAHRCGTLQWSAIPNPNATVAEWQDAAAAGDPDSLLRLGNALSETGQPAEAAEAYRQAVKLEPDLVEARIGLSYALSSLDQCEPAVEAAREATEAAPECGLAHAALGDAVYWVEATGHGPDGAAHAAEAAQPHYQAALDLCPEDEAFKQVLAVARSAGSETTVPCLANVDLSRDL